MKISYNWLKHYIDIPESPEEIGHTLTDTGLEVESISAFETVKGGLNGLVIGEVLTCSKHPNADKLSMTTVDVGREKPLHIVCGAPNVAAGQKVIVATVGTTVHPTKGEPFLIKSTKIRGEQSEGMICAEDEIGLGKSHAGIMVLNTSVANGTMASTLFQIQSDFILEIGLTPNRADAASHIGVARDIKAVKKRALKWPSVELFKVNNTALSTSIVVEEPNMCPRYSGVSISNITVKESPTWLKTHLQSIGLTPINNIVDITNFVCHELGQPLHAYNMAAIEDKKIIIKTLPAGTPFTTLDGKVRKLTANDLMVCDGEGKGMCIAGVFGGIDSGITERTTNVFLEGAYWLPEAIRTTSMYHGIKTDASFRFERGTDPNSTVYAVKRAALLIQELAGGEIASEVVDFYPTKIHNRIVEIKDKNVNRLIGKALSRDVIFPILENLDIQIIDAEEDCFTVSVPPYRVDVLQEADVIEEILRIYGLNQIELTEVAGTNYLASFPAKDIHTFKRTVGEILTGNGFFEILTNSLTSATYPQKYPLKFEGEPVEIINKLSEEQGILRQTMLFTGLEVVAYNVNRKQKDVKFFEFGKIYWKDTTKSGREKYQEEERLVLYLSGNFETENWQNTVRAVGYYDLAQQVAHILQKANIENTKQEPLNHSLFEFGMKITKGKKEIGTLGKVKSTLARDFGVKQELFYADLNTSLLFKGANPMFAVAEVPKFPEVRRDLSLVLDKNVSFAEIKELVATTEKQLVKELTTFDVYEGDKIPQGKKAYALGFTLLDKTKTLTDEEIDKTMNKLMAAFEQKMGAVIRK